MMLNEEREKPRRDAAKAIIEELYYSVINDGVISLTFEQKIDSEIKKLLLLCHDQEYLDDIYIKLKQCYEKIKFKLQKTNSTVEKLARLMNLLEKSYNLTVLENLKYKSKYDEPMRQSTAFSKEYESQESNRPKTHEGGAIPKNSYVKNLIKSQKVPIDFFEAPRKELISLLNNIRQPIKIPFDEEGISFISKEQFHCIKYEISQGDVNYIVHNLNFRFIKEFNISKNSIGDKCGWIIIKMLHQFCKVLSYLNFSYTNIGNNSLCALKEAFEKNGFARGFVLKLDGNPIKSDAVCQLIIGISRSNTVEEISLADCDLDTAAIKAFSGLIKYDVKLRRISLANNYISKESYNECLYCICRNHYLNMVDLSGTHFTNENLMFLNKYLKSPALIELKLAHNKLTNEMVPVLKAIMQYNTSLMHIALEGCSITTEGYRLLKKDTVSYKAIVRRIEEYNLHIKESVNEALQRYKYKPVKK